MAESTDERRSRERTRKLKRATTDIYTARWVLGQLAEAAGEYAGLPMIFTNSPMCVHPRYRYAPLLEKWAAEAGKRGEQVLADKGLKLRNMFLCRQKHAYVVIVETATGRVGGLYHPAYHTLAMHLDTMHVACAWSRKAERRAQGKLYKLIGRARFNQYAMTGSFLETSKRSKVTYMFRRLRPTLAIRPDPVKNDMRVIAALCSHPIGYYIDTWGGAMVPTDDVISHLLLMRHDEPYYWRISNQHAAWAPEAGLMSV